MITNSQPLEVALRVAGLMMTGLVAANFVAAKRWRYRDNLADCEVMVRLFFLGVFLTLGAVFTLTAIFG